ncbi:ABC transporter ATP-binding protein [Pseudoduganella plicata]|uniref:ABC transporter n=1 Tax=Pseudoduganella plicata TaxID=321984 RepID=A0A4P7BCL4_9BURK|nr:ABC transporter ATP-binding protein [Pseudoduganella plicata]QBQ34989.1 ABC transporter ATP-binding protein [Pseudoduganella plicata]GGZ06588.1 ABC transporter [Pseudoduganella plicata]
MLEPALRFTAVTGHAAARRGRPVLDGVSLAVGAGECVGLAGVNGAGKTTLIKCLLDFVPLDGGSIAIFGVDHRRPAARAPLAYLPERFLPPAYMTGGEFLRYTLALHGQRRDDASCAGMLDTLQLEPAALKRSVRQYSKGMTQKLGLAACLLLDKPLYVLDEPASGLDPHARALFKAALRRRGDAGSAVLMTSHALADIDETCDRIAILHDGAVRFDGSPAACRARYGTDTLETAFLRAIGASAMGLPS